MASPPKPWERPGVTATAAGLAGRSSLASAPLSSSAMSAVPGPSSSSPPFADVSSSTAASPLPERPPSLASTVNQNASAYSRVGVSVSPYGGYGDAYSSPYSTPYSRFGGMGGYGGGMYGGYGGYGGGMYGSMYGGMPGMPGSPNDPNSLTNRFSNGTATTFQMLEGIVTAFGGFAQMLESTYMATHSSFFAMVSVAEQFGNLRDTLGSILGIFTLLRWIRTLVAKLTGRPPPADAMALTPAAFARFEGRVPGPDSAATPAKASRKPLLFFLAAAFGLPYLMSKMIRTMASAHDEDERRMHQPTVDPSQLEFCRLLYDFLPQAQANGSLGLELSVRKGDLVAVLTKNDPAGNPSEWWQCRSRDGRQGYLPSTYLELLKRPGQDAKMIQAAPAEKPALPQHQPRPRSQQEEERGSKKWATADSVQTSQLTGFRSGKSHETK